MFKFSVYDSAATVLTTGLLINSIS